MQKPFLLTLVILYNFFVLRADEGMWLPFLLNKINKEDLKKAGLKINVNEIYNENKPSLKDAIVVFGSGCTGEMVSPNGLVLTNHHCGLDGVQSISSVENDWVSKGFFAKNTNEEIPIPGLKVTFIVKTIDVTPIIKKSKNQYPNNESKLKQTIDSLTKANTQNTNYEAYVKSMFADNEYYLYVTETFKDVRVVAYPPINIGNFGGDYDNWMWPRHNGDFGLFRVYAAADNTPAEYNKNNKPYSPKKYLTINTQGVKENDFTMVFGFPGRTQQYLTGEGVQQVIETINPVRIQVRETRLNIWKKAMDEDKKTFVQYIDKHNYISNYYKKWQGESLGLKINKAVESKKAQEAEFQQWANSQEAYKNLIHDIDKNYKDAENAVKVNEYYNEALLGSELLKFATKIENLEKLNVNDADYFDKVGKELNKYFEAQKEFAKNYNIKLDKEATIALWDIYKKNVSEKYYPNFINENSIENINIMFAQSILFDSLNANFTNKNAQQIINILSNDIAYKMYKNAKTMYDSQVLPDLKKLQQNNNLYQLYVQALRIWQPNKKWYPDANSTMRVSFGKVKPMQPRDGIQYKYFTTLNGVIQKENKAIKEFNVPEYLKTLYENKDFGKYSFENSVPLAFISTNHTTGGNSGSPILNANGELIGLNFDRIWEGTMSDIKFDPNLCRNLAVDTRYILFIIEKYGKANWILNEMKIK